ncbi:MAG: zinc ribbon domain-containing protein [Oscillospiraceae bacterium]|nr:zinc ribbon domain-containing protein [Oscillospiraceae bacterium]
MTEVRTSLKKLLESNRIIVSIMPAAFVFLLIYPVLGLIDSFTLWGIGIFDAVQAVWYILYLFGLILCFAESIDWAIGSAFALNGLSYLVYIIRYATFNRVVYLVFYGLLAFYFLRCAFAHNRYREQGTQFSGVGRDNEGNSQGASGKPKNSFCGSCGTALSPGARFCPVCGKLQATAAPTGGSAQARGSAGYDNAGNRMSQSAGRLRQPMYGSYAARSVASFCGGTMALIFTIVLTAYLFFSFVQSFTILNIISSIPVILMCIGCWIVYVSCARQTPNTKGFSLIGVGILVIEILTDILIALGVVLGIVVMAAGKSQPTTAIGLVVIAVCALGILLVTLYWNGLRKSAVTARTILRGGAAEWETSMYAIVILCIRAVYMLIVLLAASRIRTAVTSLLSSLLYTGSFYAGGMGSGAASVIESALSSLFNIGWAARLTNLLSVVIAIFAVVILVSIRRRGRYMNRVIQ